MYEYRLKVRRRKHQQKINRYNLAKLQYNRSIDNINQGLGRAYSRAQVRLNRKRDAAWRGNQNALIQSMQKSQYGKALAAGKTGKSIARMAAMEGGALGRYYAQQSRNLVLAQQDFKMGTKADRLKAKTAQDQAYSKVVFNPTASIAPPKPVLQNVGLAMFGDIMGGIGAAAGTYAGFKSDSRLKEDIKKIGVSIDGHNIYKFKYLDEPGYYTGVMAEEVLVKNPEAVGYLDTGYLGVNYNLIDVDFREVA